jgi:hypothetical protein
MYEQTYEKDKMQLYSHVSNEQIIRLAGRVRGCSPMSDKTACGAAAFEKEANGIGAVKSALR